MCFCVDVRQFLKVTSKAKNSFKMDTVSWIEDQTMLEFDPSQLEPMDQILSKPYVVPSDKQPRDHSGQELSNLFDSHCHLD